MATFFGTHVNKVDRKGRVSVPADFRAALAGQGFQGIIVFPSFKHAALEGYGTDRFEEMSQQLDTLGEFSDEYDAVASIFAEARRLPFDNEGRILLPDTMIAFAGIGDSAAFVGRGPSFQIWDPAQFDKARAETRERVKRQGFALPPRRTPAPTGGGR